MKRVILVCICCVVHCAYAVSQPEHVTKINELDFLIGKWNVETHLRLSAQGPWDTSKATSVINKALKASTIEEDYAGTKQGKPFYIKTMFGYNNANGLLQQLFADSEHGILLIYEGSRNKDTVYFDKTWTYANGNSVKLRRAFYRISEDEFLMESQRMPQGSSFWDVTTRMRYKRIENEYDLQNMNMFFSALIVKNVDSSIKWYSNIFNLKQRNRTDNDQRGFKQVNLFNDDVIFELIELKKGIAADSLLKNEYKGYTVHSFSKVGFKVKDIERWYKHLQSQKIKFLGTMVTDPIDKRRTFLILDPDENIIQFFEE